MTATIAQRIDRLNWEWIGAALDQRGFARVPAVLKARECAELISLYDHGKFRKRIDMAQYRFGEGEYKYFDYPLPKLVAEVRSRLYERLAFMANLWADSLAEETDYPPTHEEFLARCHEQGQTRPTPLLLRYEEGGYNCLHQDLYGAIAFPLQVVFLLSRPGEDFTGGDFLLVEQRPRAQSRGEAIGLRQGEAVIFTTRDRPVCGTRGYYRVTMRHGISTLHSGRRVTLGIIFHDAE